MSEDTEIPTNLLNWWLAYREGRKSKAPKVIRAPITEVKMVPEKDDEERNIIEVWKNRVESRRKSNWLDEWITQIEEIIDGSPLLHEVETIKDIMIYQEELDLSEDTKELLETASDVGALTSECVVELMKHISISTIIAFETVEERSDFGNWEHFDSLYLDSLKVNEVIEKGLDLISLNPKGVKEVKSELASYNKMIREVYLKLKRLGSKIREIKALKQECEALDREYRERLLKMIDDRRSSFKTSIKTQEASLKSQEPLKIGFNPAWSFNEIIEILTKLKHKYNDSISKVELLDDKLKASTPNEKQHPFKNVSFVKDDRPIG
jgi:hypothetical protein